MFFLTSHPVIFLFFFTGLIVSGVVKMRPRLAKMRPIWAKMRAKMGQDGANMGQDEAKMRPI